MWFSQRRSSAELRFYPHPNPLPAREREYDTASPNVLKLRTAHQRPKHITDGRRIVNRRTFRGTRLVPVDLPRPELRKRDTSNCAGLIDAERVGGKLQPHPFAG